MRPPYLFWLIAAVSASSLHSQDLIWVDVDDANLRTAPIHLSLAPSSSPTVTNQAGISVSLNGSPNVQANSSSDLLLADAAAKQGAGEVITCTLTNLPAGTWTVESWHFQGDGINGAVQIDFRAQGGSLQTLVNQVSFSSSPVSYTITTDGTSIYELLFTEDDSNDRTCFNGLRIRSSGSASFPPVSLTDVNDTNTQAETGSPNPFFSSSPTTSNLWRQRTGFGFDLLGNNEIFEKDANGGTGDAVILETTITGLTPGVDYGLYAAFLSVPGESWRIKMGLTNSALTEFTPTTPAGLITDLGLTSVTSSNRNQYLGYLANATADINGEIVVFLDDGDTTAASQRTWLEGVAVGEAYTPPPPPPLPGGSVEVAPDGAWTWFNDERAIFHMGYLYSGYVRSDGHVGLTRYDPDTQAALHMTLSTSLSQEVDDHNNPSITVLPDDRLLVVYSRHSSRSEYYFRTSTTTTPSTDAEWSSENIRSTPNSSTYANTYRLSAESNKIYNFSRSINFNPSFSTSTDNGASFSTLQHFIETGVGGTRPYPRYVSNDSDRIDLIYTDGHPRNNNNSIYHLYYKNDAFRLSNGTVLKSVANLPIDHDANERGTQIYTFSSSPWGAGEGPDDYIPNARAWTWDIHYDTGDDIAVAFQTQLNNAAGGGTWRDDRIYYYYARWNGTSWSKRFIAQGGRGIYSAERDYGGGMSLDPEDPRVVYISTNADAPFDLSSTTNVPLNSQERYEIYRGFTNDGGETFTWEAITSNSVADNLRPIISKNHNTTESVIWFYGTYTTYTNYSTKVIGRFGTPTTDFQSFAQSNTLPGTISSDTDGDGVSDFTEFALQSDPNDPASQPITSFNSLDFVLPALGDRMGVDLEIESSTNLGAWVPAASVRSSHLPSNAYSGFTLSSSGGDMIISDDDPMTPKRFYRIRVAPR